MNHSYYHLLKRFEASAIGSLFIIKIVKAKPEGVELERWIELIFGLHEREIIQFESKRSFYVPGFYKPVAQIRIAGMNIPRTVPKNERVWVRFDQKYPNVIEIECPIARNNEPRLFQISLQEWEVIKKCLHQVERIKRRKKYRRKRIAKK